MEMAISDKQVLENNLKLIAIDISNITG